MPDRLSDKLEELLKGAEGKDVSLGYLRKELCINPATPAWNGLRVLMHNLITKNIVRPSGRNDGVFHVIRQVTPVKVFSVQRERHPPFDLVFPRDIDKGIQMDFYEDVVIREGDLILIGGVSNMGKTALAMNFCGENIDKKPVLLGNEYTNPEGEPLPRFINRLDAMDVNKGGWVNWIDVDSNDKFTLLPVREDYASHVIRDRINIIDWINIESGEHYMIGTILDGIKRNLGHGIAIICIQKAEGATAGRGGQFTKDFADLELLIDKLGTTEILLTVGKCKEYIKRVMGRTFGYSIFKGVKIENFREVKKCQKCFGKGHSVIGKDCEECSAKGWVDA